MKSVIESLKENPYEAYCKIKSWIDKIANRDDMGDPTFTVVMLVGLQSDLSDDFNEHEMWPEVCKYFEDTFKRLGCVKTTAEKQAKLKK